MNGQTRVTTKQTVRYTTCRTVTRAPAATLLPKLGAILYMFGTIANESAPLSDIQLSDWTLGDLCPVMRHLCQLARSIIIAFLHRLQHISILNGIRKSY